MSRHIYIIRHAKTQEMKQGQDDFSRELTKKGKKQCKKIADYITECELKVDLVLCSAATRAKETLDSIGDSLGKPVVSYNEKIYTANPNYLLELIQSIDNKYNDIMIIGHNPGIMTLSIALSDTKNSNVKDFKAMVKKFPTGSMAVFKVNVDRWQDIAVDSLVLDEFVKAKSL